MLITFNSESQRLEHPQVQLIPLSIWKNCNYFYNSISDELIALMQAKSDELETLIGKENVQVLSSEQKQSAWLAIAYSHSDLSPSELISLGVLLKIDPSELFSLAVALGSVSLLNALDIEPEVLKDMIQTNDYSIFRLAAENGHISILEYLESKVTPDVLQAMIQAKSYLVFRTAAKFGHVPVLEYLKSKVNPEIFMAMIEAEQYSAFMEAADHGHKPVLEYFASNVTPEVLLLMIKSYGYGAFLFACNKGHTEVIDYLESIVTPDIFQAMIRSDNYMAFRKAALNGQVLILQYLESKVKPEIFAAMIKAYNYGAFQEAAINGHKPVFQYLASKVGHNILQRILEADDYALFKFPATSGHKDVLEYLESIAEPEVFISAFSIMEQHIQEYGDTYITPDCVNRIQSLRSAKEIFEVQNPNGVFNITDESQARLLFYVIRHLIRRNDPIYRDDIHFLLTIPAVKALAHTNGSLGQSISENELVRLALQIGNRQAAELLLNIPAVRHLAEQHDFYAREVQGGLDLRALAQNKESAMTALTVGEQRRLADAIERYKPLITKAGGDAAVVNQLLETLKARYQQKPATITINNALGVPTTIVLPLDWDAFNQLNLSAEDKQTALKAYYQNKDHSAWRYLSKPNRWMHAQASYVNVDPNDTQSRWSTFDEYMPEIAMFYLAAIDVETPPIDEYTLETRLDHFIDEVAHIGRTHNWDRTRDVLDANQQPVLDLDGHPLREEYDDLQDDRPSCYSGVKRRLFQSVQGHALFKFLTMDVIDEEVRDFAYHHFEGMINDSNRQELYAIWVKMLNAESLTEIELSVVKRLDITTEQQQEFIDYLADKYKSQFTNEPSFEKSIRDKFELNNASDSHFVNLSYVNLESLLEETSSNPNPPKDYSIIIQELDSVSRRYKSHLDKYNNNSDATLNEKRAVINHIIEILSAGNVEPKEKMQQFNRYVFTENNGEKLKPRRDGSDFAKTLEYLFHIITFGIYSKVSKNTFAFWRSHGAVVLDEIETIAHIKAQR